MFIQTEPTPNPATIKFLPGQDICPEAIDIKSEDEAKVSPLALRLFALEGVSGVFLGADFISVSKNDDTDWAVLQPMIMNILMEHLSTGQPIVDEAALARLNESKEAPKDNEIVEQIKELLDTRVRPMVMLDGGDIVFEDFVDGVVYLRMRGACSGCPSAVMTLKDGVENMLRHFIPEVEEVRQVSL